MAAQIDSLAKELFTVHSADLSQSSGRTSSLPGSDVTIYYELAKMNWYDATRRSDLLRHHLQARLRS